MKLRPIDRCLAWMLLALLPAGAALAQCTVDYNKVHQRIDGFGACSAWRSSWTTPQENMFYSTNSGTGTTLDGKTNFAFNGVGLSLLRTRIAPGGSTIENTIMVKAQSLGARVWSTPWSPATQFKSINNVNGGDFLSADNQAYANQLAGYVVSMQKSYNVNIYAISVQNEPDVSASYESCLWTAQQIHDFVPYLAAALAASNVASTKIIAAEDEHWQTNYYATALNDSAVATNVSIVACHNYDGDNTPAPLPLYANPNAAEWETEVAKLSSSGPFDGSITDALYWAGRIQLFMTNANVNAWHYWWLISANPDNEGLTDTNGYPALRMYALGNFSRFVRPNFYRIDTAGSGAVLVSAYKDSASTAFAIVAVNSATNAVSQTFNLANFTASGPITPWLTSAASLLVSQSTVAAANSSFTYMLPAQSVVTFSGKADLPPTNIFLSHNSLSEGLPAGTVVGSLSTGDPISGNTFTYSLVGGTGGNDNASFVITNQTLYTAAVFDCQAQNNFSLRIRSTDQNGLCLEQVFPVSVTFNAQARGITGASTTAGGYLTLTFSGIPGAICQVLAATNLTPPVTWLPVTNSVDGTTNFLLPPNGLCTNTDFNSTNFPAQFYITVEQ